MKELMRNEEYDVRLWPSDWRYSAAIVGLIKYFEYHDMDYNVNEDGYLEYHSEDVIGEEAEVKYLLFVEKYFTEYMHHKMIEKILSKENLTEEQIKLVKEKMVGNTICKKVFGKIKYSEENRTSILNTIHENRFSLIKETYRSAKSMYAKYANTNRLFADGDRVCRLLGYYVDLPKKSKSMSYYWNYNTYVAEDICEFDFIPFAFTKTRDAYFINNNYDINYLYRSNEELQDKLESEAEAKKKNPRFFMFQAIKSSTTFLDYDVEVIERKQDEEIYQTLYIRKPAINIFKNISEAVYDALRMPCRLSNGKYLSMEDLVTDRIINGLHLDDLIEIMIKEDVSKKYIGSVLININSKIYGGKNMDTKCYYAKKTADAVRKNLISRKTENKIKSYQQKLISCITFKDYDRFNEILLQFSAYVEIPFDFAYDLFTDFEENKNVAYAFTLGLGGDYSENDNTKGGNE